MIGLPFVHIGDDVVVPAAAIVAVVNLETTGEAAATREFLELARAERRVAVGPGGGARAAVIAGETVFLSPISASTLARRAARQPLGWLE